jgi:single-strand DNA-binding protein
VANFNKVLLMGNLTREPEIKYTPKGTAICQLGMAINRYWKDENGQDKEEVTFVEVEVWGKQAEAASKYLSKGRPVFIEGRLKLDQWDDKESGQKRSRLKVVCERIQFIGAPKNVEFSGDASANSTPRRTAAAQPDNAPAPLEANAGAASAEDDDIPF